MRILGESDVCRLLRPEDILAAVRAAAVAAESGECIVPDRLHLDWGGGTLLTMPAYGNGRIGVKLVSIVPGNAGKGLPVTNGVMILNDGETGLPLALLNAAVLTARRTGAVGALGLSLTAPPDVSSIGVVGCGTQGLWQAIAACAVRPIQEVFCASRSEASVGRFRQALARHVPNVKVRPCRDAAELLGRTSVVIAATTSATPVLPDEPALLRDKHFISIGSYTTEMQELPDSVYRLAEAIVLDTENARTTVGDAVNPVSRGMVKPENVFTIGKLIEGERSVRREGTTVFKSVGMALFDLFVARAMVDEAVRGKVGAEADL